MSAATDPTETVAWVALGSNIGHRGRALSELRGALSAGGTRIAAASAEIVTRPVGMLAQADFLNQVLRLDADPPLAASAWLRRCKEAEAAAGRRPSVPQGPRRADADVLLLGADGSVRTHLAELDVPHPGLPRRPFLWRLLAELAPGLRHPDGWLFSAGPAGDGVSPNRDAD